MQSSEKGGSTWSLSVGRRMKMADDRDYQVQPTRNTSFVRFTRDPRTGDGTGTGDGTSIARDLPQATALLEGPPDKRAIHLAG
ncbi:hypothetical protein YP76_25005 [Sphingobium chungbukense]|uniref:Uncharacterized protein n=1 Tax=Sphingobium chungbukense TaxID=56193 RepID=A0A0M3AHE1_9SPHN|nr:hypothetical protein YP76_25005 [Sphingobium chungbukense]